MSTNPMPLESAYAQPQTPTRPWVLYIGLGVLVLYIAFILLFRVDRYPSPHFDEGAFMKVAKNFALNGIYADFSAEGDRYTGAIVSTGPTLILPVALVYKLFGVGIPQARLVNVAYSILLLIAMYGLSARLLDRRLAIATVALATLFPGSDMERLTRTVMGELPGMFFLFVAFWVWFTPTTNGAAGAGVSGAKRGDLRRLVGVGVLFGLCCITKNQLALFVLPSILAAFVLELIWYRKRGWLYFVIPGIVAGLVYFGWSYYVLNLLGAQSRDVAQDLALLREATASSFVISGATISANLRSLLENPFIVPLLFYGLIILLRRESQPWGILFVFMVASVGVFIFSIGWARYSAPVLLFSALFLAHLLHTLTNGFRLNWQDLKRLVSTKEQSYTALVSVVIIMLVVGYVSRPTFLRLTNMLTMGSDTHARLQKFLAENVPLDSVVYTWENEVGVLTNHRYSFPPYVEVVDQTVKMPAGKLAARQHDFRAWVKPDYLIIKQPTGWYLPEQLVDFELAQKIDNFEVYRHK